MPVRYNQGKLQKNLKDKFGEKFKNVDSGPKKTLIYPF